MISLDCPACTSSRTLTTTDIPTGDRDRMCATCGHHWYPAPLHPGLPACCAQTVQSRPRTAAPGNMLRCALCGRTLVLHGYWRSREEGPGTSRARDTVAASPAHRQLRHALSPPPAPAPGSPATEHPRRRV